MSAELPLLPARQEYAALRALEDLEAPSVIPVGLVERPWLDPGMESSAAVITVGGSPKRSRTASRTGAQG